MDLLSNLYGRSLALLTDLYQLTMAYGFWKQGMSHRRAVYHLVFRRHPFQGQYAVACGLRYAIDYLSGLRFTADDLQYLGSLRGADDKPLFEAAFLEHLGQQTFACDVDALPEGTVVFAHQPLVRVRGPILQCQIIETALLNVINFQTLIATKASRVVRAARGEQVLEFGLRRAQGIDGGIAASRAAYIGGCHATSNVLAGRLFGIPVKGTHAHSWVMAFDDELQSFQAYAESMPNNCIFLVDTFDTPEGIRHAIQTASWLKREGHQMLGVRLDSGDLVGLSRQARRMLDDAGLTDAVIVASNELDELQIDQLKRDGAKINVWGVGTRLATAYDQPALGGVYKLSAIETDAGSWQYKLKLSEEPIKVSNPGIHQVRRYRRGDRWVGDLIYDEPTGVQVEQAVTLSGQPLDLTSATSHQDLLVPAFRQGRVVYDSPPESVSRQHAIEQLEGLDESVKRLRDAEPYPVGMDRRLWTMKRMLMDQVEVRQP